MTTTWILYTGSTREHTGRKTVFDMKVQWSEIVIAEPLEDFGASKVILRFCSELNYVRRRCAVQFLCQWFKLDPTTSHCCCMGCIIHTVRLPTNKAICCRSATETSNLAHGILGGRTFTDWASALYHAFPNHWFETSLELQWTGRQVWSFDGDTGADTRHGHSSYIKLFRVFLCVGFFLHHDRPKASLAVHSWIDIGVVYILFGWNSPWWSTCG